MDGTTMVWNTSPGMEAGKIEDGALETACRARSRLRTNRPHEVEVMKTMVLELLAKQARFQQEMMEWVIWVSNATGTKPGRLAKSSSGERPRHSAGDITAPDVAEPPGYGGCKSREEEAGVGHDDARSGMEGCWRTRGRDPLDLRDWRSRKFRMLAGIGHPHDVNSASDVNEELRGKLLGSVRQ